MGSKLHHWARKTGHVFTSIRAESPRITHDEIDDAVAEFLSKGGAVEQIETGHTGRKNDTHYRFRLPNSDEPA